MEDLAPPLKCLLCVRFSIKSGFSIRQGLQDYLNIEQQDEFAAQILRWLTAMDQGQDTSELLQGLKSVYRTALLELLAFGMSGHSILAQLTRLEEEMITRSWDEIEDFVATLPFKLMLPLLLFQFPAFLLLIIGPILGEFMKGLSQW